METCYTFELEAEVSAAAAAAFVEAIGRARLTVVNHGRSGSGWPARRWFISARRPFSGRTRAAWLAEALDAETAAHRAAEALGIPAPSGFGAWVDDGKGGPVLPGYCY